MRRKKFIFLFTLFILIFLCYLLLNNNDFSIKYNSTNSLMNNFYDYYLEYQKNISIDEPLDKEKFFIIGEYQNGYVLMVNEIKEYPEHYPDTKKIVINDIEIIGPYGAYFIYYQNKILSKDILCFSLEVMYHNKYINDKNLIDIKNKLEQYKDNLKPYCVDKHFSIK